MNKLKVEINIPGLNMKGEMKPIKSMKLVEQLEQILTENKLDYKLTYSAYEDGEKDERS